MIFAKIQRAICRPSLMWSKLLNSLYAMRLLSDKSFLSLKFRLRMGYFMDWKHPRTYNEKLQWLKLYDRRPEYMILADKVKVKDWVAERIGREYIIPTLGVWTDASEIDFSILPEQFVIKCNHNSGTIYICKDKRFLDENKVRNGLRKGLRDNYYCRNGEWPYKKIPRRIIAESYLEDNRQGELRDYKFFCFDGEVKALFIATDRMTAGEETKFDFFDADFQHLPFRNGHPNADRLPDKPKNFELMKQLAACLSTGIPHVRVDLYEVNGQVYFGEMTFFHWSGMTPFEPEEWDYTFGEWLVLPVHNKQ